MSPTLLHALAAAAGVLIIPALYGLFRCFTIEIEDDEALLVKRLGRHTRTLTRAGLHFFPERLLPWVKLVRVSLRRDFRHFEGIHINDARGTTVLVDLWLELRIKEPEKALFQVEDWDRSLQNLVTHSAIFILGNREFHEILCDRSELGHHLEQDIAVETARWGIEIELVFIRNVRLLPEVSRQVFVAVAARLERAKADIEEEGRLRVALLEADTAARIAQLVADAKGQYPAAVGRVFSRLRSEPEVFKAYNELYELSLIRPHRTIAFSGFREGELRAVDALMASPLADKAAE
jgi:regulator of protease activity HflC (stomatin/prohibitin superfamily)